jgi:23S rRNA maturation-related 3'-5' exoribonuclease YhaM
MTDKKLKEVLAHWEMKFKELESWYNGYLTAKGIKIYNSRSVVKSLQNNHCESYWTNTGAMDEVAEYLKYNILEIRNDVIKMVSGKEIEQALKDKSFVYVSKIIENLKKR